MKIKSIAAYIVLIAVSVLFMLFLDGRGGAFLLILLVTAAVISISVCIYTRYNISVDLNVSEDILEKNDIAVLTLRIKKRGFVPSAVIEADFFGSFHFQPLTDLKIKAVCLSGEESALKAEFSGKYFGKGKVGVSSVTVSDYLGLCSFRVPVQGSIINVKVYPDIPDINEKNGFSRSLTDAAMFDDNEETSETGNLFQGSPGYEHRPYEPGDNLKMINWKLSAKRDELYVRKLEGSSASEQLLILDKKGGTNEQNQLAAEAMLALVDEFSKSELPVRVLIRLSDIWEEIVVSNQAETAQLRYTFTEYSFINDGVNRFPTNMTGDRIILFTPCADDGFCSYISERKSLGKECTAAAADGMFDGEIWKITRDDCDICFER